MTNTEQLELEALRAENARLKAQANAPLKLKVTEKGGLSVYGVGRFPVTLYREQWEKLLQDANVAAIKAAIAKLPTKAEKVSQAAEAKPAGVL